MTPVGHKSGWRFRPALRAGLPGVWRRLQSWWQWTLGPPALFARSPLPMWIYEATTLRFLAVNDTAVRHYGYSRAEFLRMTVADIRPPEEVPELEMAVRYGMSAGREWKHRRKDGSCMLMKITSNQVYFRGRPARCVVAEDVTERVNLHAELIHMAHHDGLTGLPNRMLLEQRMKEACAAADTRRGRAGIVCLDLDRFKQLNDRFGHAGGDECLKQIATMLRRRVRGMDTVARTGGEEFTVLLGELEGRNAAEKVGMSLLRGFDQPVMVEGVAVQVTASMGIAVYPDDGRSMGELQRAADTAMYRAKRTGGNRFVLVSPDMDSVAQESEAIAAHMGEMLRGEGFEIHYQPQVSAGGGIRMVEALLRLPHPLMGYVSSERFIPIAEENGMIGRLGLWVIGQACRDLKGWREQGYGKLRVAVNVSPLQLRAEGFAERVLNLVGESGLSPDGLELEITEGVVLNFDDVVGQMRALSAAGVTFAVDDFGVGYSSLQHLHRLPISTVKIDRSFSERICESRGSYPIVEAIVSMGHSLGMQVIAEGVETEAQLEAVTTLGCDAVQGWIYSPAVKPDAVLELLRRADPVTAVVGEGRVQRQGVAEGVEMAIAARLGGVGERRGSAWASGVGVGRV